MKKVITYGTYDLLHHGHIALLERAKKLGDYLIVGVTADAFDKRRGKLNVKQPLAERIEAIRKTGLADEIIIEEYVGQKIIDIQSYDIDVFTVGSDWIGKFDYLKEYCEVVYLPRTEGISSTKIRTEQNPILKVGFLGTGRTTDRFYKESTTVGSLCVKSVYAQENTYGYNNDELEYYSNKKEFFDSIDAVYIDSSADKHYSMIKESLENDCHVLCNPPLFLNRKEAIELYDYAYKKGLILFEAEKTRYFPALTHLLLQLKSGIIGEVKDIDISCSQILNNMDNVVKNKYEGSFYDWSSTVLFPIISILGKNIGECKMYSFEKNNFSYLTKGILDYGKATATFKAGIGVKTEGHLVITGTKGYVYVPSPWWKIDYFEVRYEDLRDTKKYFYEYKGNGFRYLMLEFIKLINNINVNNANNKEYCMLFLDIMEKYSQAKVSLYE
ncbi:hypothetical protein AXE85_01055 [Gemella sp. oral taxon 928]|nr:hypothetical protein AXE85_01055 [Gemella sp. oral taxon 928]AXI26450.1 glycerol-3-phosphate cytidylyltransferase [Gemella sp. ND 6198]